MPMNLFFTLLSRPIVTFDCPRVCPTKWADRLQASVGFLHWQDKKETSFNPLPKECTSWPCFPAKATASFQGPLRELTSLKLRHGVFPFYPGVVKSSSLIITLSCCSPPPFSISWASSHTPRNHPCTKTSHLIQFVSAISCWQACCIVDLFVFPSRQAHLNLWNCARILSDSRVKRQEFALLNELKVVIRD